MSNVTPSDDVKRGAVKLEAKQSRRIVFIIFLGFVLSILLSIKVGSEVVINDPNETSWVWQAFKIFAWSLIPWCGLLIFAFLTVFRHAIGAHATVEKNSEALALMNSGQRDAAAGILQDLSRKSKLLAQEVNLNRARLFIQQQRMVDAQVLLEKLADQKSPSIDFTISVLATHAEYYALQGELEAGEQSYDQAVELCSTRARKGALVFAETLLRLRRGAFKLVVDMPDDEWFSAEGSLPAPAMKRLRVLRAFAIRCLPPAQQSPKAQEEIQALLAGARPFWRGEFDFLAARWPDLKTFLVESGLAFEKGIVTSSVRQ